MVLKQKILKEERIKFFIIITSVLIPLLAIEMLVVLNKDNINLYFWFFFVSYLLLFLPILFLALNQLEWYHLYVDRIEARGIFGVKNKVYYRNVLFVEEMKIPLTSRGTYKAFFIFHDGRKNTGDFLGRNSCYNRKKYNLRIYKTPEVEKYIIETLCFEIQGN